MKIAPASCHGNFESPSKKDNRTSAGKKPMCATVCPSQALAYLRPEDIARNRREIPVNTFQFGHQRVTTKVFMMAPPGSEEIGLDVTDYMGEGETLEAATK